MIAEGLRQKKSRCGVEVGQAVGLINTKRKRESASFLNDRVCRNSTSVGMATTAREDTQGLIDWGPPEHQINGCTTNEKKVTRMERKELKAQCE